MCTHGSPDIYTLSPRALGVYIRQTTRAHGITIKYIHIRICMYAYNVRKYVCMHYVQHYI